MARRGFRPVRRQRPRGVDLVLERCPFESAAAANPSAVCSLHLGLAKGLADGIGGVEVEDLVAKNPHKAGCRLVMKEASGARLSVRRGGPRSCPNAGDVERYHG